MILRAKCFLWLCFGLSISLPVCAQTPTAQTYFEQGLEFVSRQKYNEALEAFRQSVKLDAGQAATHGNIGTSLILLKRPDEAVVSFREAAKLAPDDGTFRTALCQALILTKSYAEALTQCAEGVRLNDNQAARLALLNAAQIAKRPADEILRFTETALEKFPDDEALSNFGAAIYLENGNPARASAMYEKLAQAHSQSAVYQINLADSYLRLERDADALAAARKAIALEPQNAAAYYFSGRIYFELGQHEEAANAFRKAAEINPADITALYFLGLSEIRRGKTASGIESLRKAVAAAPENFDYNKELGSALLADTKYEEAFAPLKKAVALKPKNFESIAALGTALSEAGRYDEALTMFEAAERLKPGNEIVNMLMNVARARQQSVPQIEPMKSYAKTHPDDLNVRLQLVQLLTYTHRASEAAVYFDEIGKLNPTDPRVYSMIGVLHSTTGNYEKAAEAYRKLLELGENPAAYLGLANIYAKSGQVDEAVKAYDKVFELKPDSPNIIKLYADFLRDNGRRREALAMYQRSLTMLPNNAPVLFNAGILAAKFGDMNAAKSYLSTLKLADPPQAKILERFLRLPR